MLSVWSIDRGFLVIPFCYSQGFFSQSTFFFIKLAAIYIKLHQRQEPLSQAGTCQTSPIYSSYYQTWGDIASNTYYLTCIVITDSITRLVHIEILYAYCYMVWCSEIYNSVVHDILSRNHIYQYVVFINSILQLEFHGNY